MQSLVYRGKRIVSKQPFLTSLRLVWEWLPYRAETTSTYLPYNYEPVTLTATLRDSSGKIGAKNARKSGRLPSILFSLPENQSKLLTLDPKQFAREVARHGRRGIVCRIYNLQIQLDGEQGVEEYRVLPRMVHVNAVSYMVENVTLLYMPPERFVTVDIPVRIIGEDVAPGVRRGGYVNEVRKTITCRCPSTHIPPAFQVDVSKMELGERVTMDQMVFPEGVVVVDKDPKHPVCKMAGKLSREAAAEAKTETKA